MNVVHPPSRRSPGLTLGGAERRVALAVWGAGLVACLLGLLVSPSANVHPSLGVQAIDLVRIAGTVALGVTLVLGPGLALRTHGHPDWSLGYLVLPGLLLIAAAGVIAWLLGLAGFPHATVVTAVFVGPTLAWLGWEITRGRVTPLTTTDERVVLSLVALALGVAVGKATWSLGPVGELFGGEVLRTLEIGDRSDPTINYHVAELVAQGASPSGALSRSYFLPYSFSTRGPLAGIAAVPVMMLTGAHPPLAVGSAPWTPFDPDGFAAYRLAMMVFACTSFLALFTLVERIGGRRAARFAVLLAVTTPFLVHEIWFVWPKLLAGTLVLLAAARLLDRRAFQAGLLLGLAYLVHPVALFMLPTLALLALWPVAGRTWRHPRVGQLLWLIAGVAIWALLWRLVNLHDYTQGAFTSYVTEAGRTRAYFSGHDHPTLGAWVGDRLVSLANTLVPLRLFFFEAGNQSINSAYQACFPQCIGGSPPIVQFYFQYWTSLPFAFGILFFPLLLGGLARAACRWWWPTCAVILVPFVVFWLYWGDANTGLMREGLQIWSLGLVAVLALEQSRRGFPWLTSPAVRLILCFRVLELALDALLPTIWTRHEVIDRVYALNDVVALAVLVTCGALLVYVVWDARGGDDGGSPGSDAGSSLGADGRSLRR